MMAANSDGLPMLSKASPEETQLMLIACAAFDAALQDQTHHTGADPLQQ